MGFFAWLRQLLRGLTSPPSQPESSDQEFGSIPKEWTKTVFDAPEVHIAVSSMQTLVDQNDRIPEIVACRYIANALEDMGLNYRIKRGYAPVETDSDENLLSQWIDADREWIAKDANVLLTDRPGGGMSYVGGRFGHAPAAHIDESIDWQRTGDSLLHRNVHAILHEIGHMLGAKHDHDQTQEGMQHPGMGWNEAGFWHRTPTVAGNGYPNLCGEEIETKASDRVMRHQLYHDCFLNHIQIATDDELS